MRTKLVIAAVLAALGALTGVTLASADSNGSADDNGQRVIKLFSVTVQQHSSVDMGPAGRPPTLGDNFVFSDKLLDKKGGTQVGFDGVVCTIVRLEPMDKPTDATLQCVATLSLSGGQIAVQGLFPTPLAENKFPPPTDLAITGGTGDFEDAGGHITVEELNATEANITVVLHD